MIKRAPKPQSGFLVIRNEVLRDSRLSYRARGLLASMLTYPDNWTFNRDWLAAQSEREGQAAVRAALGELERNGYLKRERRKDPVTGKFGWEQVVYDVPQGSGGVFAVRSIGQVPTDGKPTAGNLASKEEPRGTTEEEDELNSPHSGRFAPSVGAHGDSNSEDPWAAVPNQRRATEDEPADEGFDDWRQEDRAIFTDILGAKLKSAGGRWNAGVWPTNAFYTAYRKRTDRNGNLKALRWPGRYLQELADSHDEALDDWLISEGLERVE